MSKPPNPLKEPGKLANSRLEAIFDKRKVITDSIRLVLDTEKQDEFKDELRNIIDNENRYYYQHKDKRKVEKIKITDKDEAKDLVLTIEELNELNQKIILHREQNQKDKPTERKLETLKVKTETIQEDLERYISENSIDLAERENDDLKQQVEDDRQEIYSVLTEMANVVVPTKTLKEKLDSWSNEIQSIRSRLGRVRVVLETRKKRVKRTDLDDEEQFSGVGAESANGFLTAVDDAFMEFRRSYKSVERSLNDKARRGYSTRDVGSKNNEINKLKDEIKFLESKRKDDQEALDSRRAAGDTRLTTYERVLADTMKRLADKEKSLERAEGKLGDSVTLNPEDFAQDFDQGIALVRRYQQQLRQALKEHDVNSELRQKQERMRLKNILQKKFSEYAEKFEAGNVFPRVMSDIVNEVRLSKVPRSKMELVEYIRTMALDNASEVQISLSVVHREILRAIDIKDDAWGKNKSAFLMIYLFKSLRVASSWLAFYLADKLFTEYYRKNKSAAANPKTVDLRWFVAIYASFQLAFDLIAMVVMYFVRRIDPDVVSGALILDYAFDSVMVTLLVLSSSVWVADIIQDKKYFSYRTNGKRAVRALRTIMVWLLILHSLAPYFYFAGPNFTGRAKSKELDTRVRQAKEKAKTKAA